MDIRAFLCPLAQILIPQIPPTQKGKEVMKGMLHSPVAAAEKEIWSGAGQKTSLGRKRRPHGRGRYLGSGANAAKFTVNVWEKS